MRLYNIYSFLLSEKVSVFFFFFFSAIFLFAMGDVQIKHLKRKKGKENLGNKKWLASKNL